jgi:hypothetical protein
MSGTRAALLRPAPPRQGRTRIFADISGELAVPGGGRALGSRLATP